MEEYKEEYNTVIIGGGPAGLFCALQVAGTGSRRHRHPHRHRRVLVLEKKSSCGRKLIITGSGQCNLTHGGEITAFFAHYGDKGKFLRPALMNFTNRDLIAFFNDLGVATVTEKGEKIFPETKKSSDVLDLLLSECKKRGVEIHCNEAVHDLAIKDGRFILKSGVPEYHADNLVIATGGASYPATGSSGDGYALARQLGQPITEISPGLSPVYIEDYHFSDLSGISFENISISLFRDNKKISQHRGDLLFTHTGLSGPGVLDLSRYIAPGDLLKISFIPDIDTETFRKDLTDRFQANQTRHVKTILSEYPLPERFVKRILELTEISPELTSAHLSKKLRNRLIINLTELPFRVKKLAGFEKAMVTRGGVTLGRINQKTMESRLVPHLWFIGEVLDIDGDTGGYNLQAAFSTAVLAAEHIVSEENREENRERMGR